MVSLLTSVETDDELSVAVFNMVSLTTSSVVPDEPESETGDEFSIVSTLKPVTPLTSILQE
jgi:hypothetical protein